MNRREADVRTSQQAHLFGPRTHARSALQGGVHRTACPARSACRSRERCRCCGGRRRSSAGSRRPDRFLADAKIFSSAWALDSLAQFAERDASLRAIVDAALDAFERSGRPALRAGQGRFASACRARASKRSREDRPAATRRRSSTRGRLLIAPALRGAHTFAYFASTVFIAPPFESQIDITARTESLGPLATVILQYTSTGPA